MASSTESLPRKAHSPTTSQQPFAEKPAKALATASPWRLLGLGRSTWYRLLAQGRAPAGTPALVAACKLLKDQIVERMKIK
jgi:hypothetical protein